MSFAHSNTMKKEIKTGLLYFLNKFFILLTIRQKYRSNERQKRYIKQTDYKKGQKLIRLESILVLQLSSFKISKKTSKLTNVKRVPKLTYVYQLVYAYKWNNLNITWHGYQKNKETTTPILVKYVKLNNMKEHERVKENCMCVCIHYLRW